MNYYILLICLALTFVGCETREDLKEKASYKATNWTTITEIDSCEYITFKTYGGIVNFTHKGNCKFCAERNQKMDYQIDVKHNTVILYDGSRKVGEFDLTAELDSLIINDNQ